MVKKLDRSIIKIKNILYSVRKQIFDRSMFQFGHKEARRKLLEGHMTRFDMVRPQILQVMSGHFSINMF